MDAKSPLPKRILLVEDNADDEKLSLRALKRSGLRLDITVARDGKEAIDLLDSGTIFNMVISDLKMPRVDGVGVTEAIRLNPRMTKAPVVVFSSSDERADIQRCLDSGADSFVCKPIDFDSYIQVLCLVAQYWLNRKTSSGIPPYCLYPEKLKSQWNPSSRESAEARSNYQSPDRRKES